MGISFINSSILKPSFSSSQVTENTIIPLTIFDQANFNHHVVVLYAFKPPMPSNEILKAALSHVLTYFPVLAGRLSTHGDGHPCIVLNNAGIRMIETSLPCTLDEQLPLDPSSDVSHLLPNIDGIEELFQIQINRYSCGGVVMAQTAHHRVGDGQSLSSFFVAWAKFIRGLGVDPLPYHDRASITIPRNQPRVDFDHHSIEFRKSDDIKSSPVFVSPFGNIITHYSPDFVNKLKSKVNIGPDDRYSTFECLLAHVWKKVTQARGLKHEEYSQVRVAVNGRMRIKPRVPMSYFGNLVLWAYPRLTVREILKESHAYIAKAIHDAVAKVDSDYFKSFIDFGELSKRNDIDLEGASPETGNTLCPNLEVDSWLRFQFHDVDFGGGRPCAFYPPNIPIDGLVIFLPSCQDDGGIDLVTALIDEHADIFKEISHSLE